MAHRRRDRLRQVGRRERYAASVGESNVEDGFFPRLEKAAVGGAGDGDARREASRLTRREFPGHAAAPGGPPSPWGPLGPLGQLGQLDLGSRYTRLSGWR